MLLLEGLRLLLLEALNNLAQLCHLRCELGYQRHHIWEGHPVICWICRVGRSATVLWDQLPCVLRIYMHIRASSKGQGGAVQVGTLAKARRPLLT